MKYQLTGNYVVHSYTWWIQFYTMKYYTMKIKCYVTEILTKRNKITTAEDIIKS